MTFLLDTNVCIAYLNGRSANVVQRLGGVSPSEITVCSVVKAELFFGAMRSRIDWKYVLRLADRMPQTRSPL